MSKMDGQLLQAEKFFAAKECTSCATVFGKRHKKDNKLSFYPYKPDSAKDNIYRSVQKTEEKEWADKIIFLCLLNSFFHCQYACASFYL